MSLLIRWLLNAGALLVLPFILPGISVAGFGAALITALILGLVNAVVRPVLVILTLPVTILTLGLFLIIINGLMFWFVSYVVKGFDVAGFWWAVAGALVYSVLTTLTSWLIGKATDKG